MSIDFLEKFRKNSPEIVLDWNTNNLKLKCKMDFFAASMLFKKEKCIKFIE